MNECEQKPYFVTAVLMCLIQPGIDVELFPMEALATS